MQHKNRDFMPELEQDSSFINLPMRSYLASSLQLPFPQRTLDPEDCKPLSHFPAPYKSPGLHSRYHFVAWVRSLVLNTFQSFKICYYGPTEHEIECVKIYYLIDFLVFLPTKWNYVIFDITTPQLILHLNDSDWTNCMSSPNCVCTCFRQPDVLYLSLFHQLL